jgi:hypothetical protein
MTIENFIKYKIRTALVIFGFWYAERHPDTTLKPVWLRIIFKELKLWAINIPVEKDQLSFTIRNRWKQQSICSFDFLLMAMEFSLIDYYQKYKRFHFGVCFFNISFELDILPKNKRYGIEGLI